MRRWKGAERLAKSVINIKSSLSWTVIDLSSVLQGAVIASDVTEGENSAAAGHSRAFSLLVLLFLVSFAGFYFVPRDIQRIDKRFAESFRRVVRASWRQSRKSNSYRTVGNQRFKSLRSDFAAPERQQSTNSRANSCKSNVVSITCSPEYYSHALDTSRNQARPALSDGLGRLRAREKNQKSRQAAARRRAHQ